MNPAPKGSWTLAFACKMIARGELGTTMDLGNWLRSLGLERYEAAFRENEIDETVLPELTQDHLREIGIPLGARIKLLKAIATLKEPNKAVDPASTGTEAPFEVRSAVN